MATVSGRPRKACGTCKAQKIRCTGERPACRRCHRLQHTCVYHGDLPEPPASPKSRPKRSLQVFGSQQHHQRRRVTGVPVPSPTGAHPNEKRYLGIPDALLSPLIECYFENVYNAHLLLHKRLFLESVSAGTVRPHVLLGVCALASNFYCDSGGRATLKDHGFMVEWAQRAGKLVLLEAEAMHEENVVTYVNLALFWHSQGSWRMSYFYKGNACNLLHITGLGRESLRKHKSLNSELRRRRFWACYLMHCHTSEPSTFFESTETLKTLALPWLEEDFAAGQTSNPQETLESGNRDSGMWASLIRILTLWMSVVEYIKSPNSAMSMTVPAIHSLHERMWRWWRELRPEFQLTASSIGGISQDTLPKILMMNIVYHQSICALHASIVPLFCWGESDDGWSSARQLSAQTAFEHACTVSALLEVALSTYDRISAMPSFISFAAYSGCAIQIPFMWSSNSTLKAKTTANVRANVKMIHQIAEHWKFAEILKFYVQGIYRGHRQHPTILGNEPKDVDPSELTNSKACIALAKISILEFTSILKSKDHGGVNIDSEIDLEPANCPFNEQNLSPLTTARNDLDTSEPSTEDVLLCATSAVQPNTELSDVEQHQPDVENGLLGHNLQGNFMQLPENQPFDLMLPLFDPGMLDLFPDGNLPDFSQTDTTQLAANYFNLEGANACY